MAHIIQPMCNNFITYSVGIPWHFTTKNTWDRSTTVFGWLLRMDFHLVLTLVSFSSMRGPFKKDDMWHETNNTCFHCHRSYNNSTFCHQRVINHPFQLHQNPKSFFWSHKPAKMLRQVHPFGILMNDLPFLCLRIEENLMTVAILRRKLFAEGPETFD